MSKHTPGPWRYSEGTNTIRGLSGTDWIGSVTSEHSPRGKANARLIAAAPELLQAAKEALISLEAANEVMGGGQVSYSEITGKPFKKTQSYYESSRKALRAAIAKAEGRKE